MSKNVEKECAEGARGLEDVALGKGECGRRKGDAELKGGVGGLILLTRRHEEGDRGVWEFLGLDQCGGGSEIQGGRFAAGLEFRL